MRYRDLVFVLCLVAVAAVWWSYPIRADSTDTTEVAEIGSLSPSPAASATPEEPLKLDPSALEMFKVPELALVLKERGKRVEDIVLQATLSTEVDALIPMLNDQPCATIRFTSLAQTWNWRPRSKEVPINKELKNGETMTWELSLKSFSPLDPVEDVKGLEALLAREPLSLDVSIVEGGSIESHPFLRSRYVSMDASVIIPVSDQ